LDFSIYFGKYRESGNTFHHKMRNLSIQWYKNSKTGQWQVYDMTAGGASMVNTKQQEWSPIIRKQGLDALTAQLQKSADTPITLSKKSMQEKSSTQEVTLL